MSSQKENEDHPTPEEMHRLKQRNQYQLMLSGLTQLSDVLPPTIAADKMKSKQILLSEAVNYIHYLQICIYQLGKDEGSNEDEIGQRLHWDVHSDDPCECIKTLKDICNGRSSVNTAVKVTHSDGSDDDDIEKQCAKRIRRSSTPTSTWGCRSASKRKSHRRRAAIRKNAKGSKLNNEWRLSPIKSPVGLPQQRVREKTRGILTKRSTPNFRSPPGTYCDILSPPNSYRRTIIEDSPQDLSNAQNWENVSVRKSNIPWMPKPDNKYGSVEDLAEKIVIRYGEPTDSDLMMEDGVNGHVLSRSHPLDSFLDSSYTEDELAPFTDLESSAGLCRPRPNLDDSESTTDHPLLQQHRARDGCSPADPLGPPKLCLVSSQEHPAREAGPMAVVKESTCATEVATCTIQKIPIFKMMSRGYIRRNAQRK